MAEQVPCSFCKQSIPLDSKYCPFCGGDQTPVPSPAGPRNESAVPSQVGSLPNAGMQPQDRPQNGATGWVKRNKILVIVLAAGGLILACCICSYLFPFMQGY